MTLEAGDKVKELQHRSEVCPEGQRSITEEPNMRQRMPTLETVSMILIS